MKQYILLIFLMLGSNALAFDSQKCKQFRHDDFSGGSLFSSTTSYISSTGPCAALAYHSKESKEMYYAQNELELQLDVSKGEGVYLSELNSIYSCSDKSQVNKILMQNYQSIYDSKKPSNAIDSIMQTQNCKYL